MGRPSEEFRRVWLPYCLARLADGRYVALNRHYKFLGMPPSEFVDYESAPAWARIKITAPQARKLHCGETFDPERLYLYSDATVPTMGNHWSGYQARLELLARMKVG